jgi:hypothetical protein
VTSMEGLQWLTRRQLDGGIDRLELPAAVPGALWMCGKHAIGPDHRRLIDEVGGAASIVCLVERHEIEARYPTYVAWLDRDRAGDVMWRPIADLDAPSVEGMTEVVDEIVDRLHRGETLIVHCAAGMGRAGTVATCVLIRLGVGPADALRAVSEVRPGAGPEVGAQRDMVETFHAARESGDG